MSGEIISRPPAVHKCVPGWEWRQVQPDSDLARLRGPDTRYGVPPSLSDYPEGTAWLCECGQVWVSTGPIAANIRMPEFRKESWWERRKRRRR